ncbi:hypothetical protein J3E69DRAFT_322940 [Trichoderma sp. SZMC 28015]
MGTYQAPEHQQPSCSPVQYVTYCGCGQARMGQLRAVQTHLCLRKGFCSINHNLAFS